jgi:hypothetical protein
MAKLETLCYTVGDMAMFMPEADLQNVDMVKKWHDDPKSRVTDLDEAAERLSDYVQSRGDEEVAADVYGPVSEAAQREQDAKAAEERRARIQVRTVELDSAFKMAHVVADPAAGDEPSVSGPTLSGAAQAASHPNVKHLTDTLVRMGYLEDLQKGVFLLSDPLGIDYMGRRNRIAKHIKSKADAEEAMLVLCREGKMDLVVQGLFRIPHFEEDEKPTDQARVSSGSSDHQPLKKKPKSVQAQPKVRKSVSSEPAKAANLYDARKPKLRALLAGLPATQVANRDTGVHKAPRIDNSGPNPACLINGKVLPVILLDCGAETVITGRAGARQMGLKPSMMDLGAVALRVADGETTKAFDRTKHPVEFVFNPKTPDETKVLSHVIVVNSEDADTLLGMSVLGKIGLTTNPYKGRVKYYVNWREPNARKAYLKSTFLVDRPSPAFAASSSGQVIEVVNAASAVQLPLSLDSPRNGFATTSTQFRLRAHRNQLTPELTSLMYRSKQALTVSVPEQPRAADPYGHLRPLDARLVDIFSMPAAQEEGLVVVELFSGISATTEALLRAGVRIKKLYCCELDPKARAVTGLRASDWLQVFPELLQPPALEGFHSFLPQNVELIGNSHILAMEKPDLVVAGFPCQGFSRASGRGLADPRTHLFTETLRIIHLIHRRRGHCGWLIENVDATDYPIDSVRKDFNEVVKRLLGEGVAYDAISVGSYAHTYRRYWQNLIPRPLLHEMVEKRHLMRSVDQQVQDVLSLDASRRPASTTRPLDCTP